MSILTVESDEMPFVIVCSATEAPSMPNAPMTEMNDISILQSVNFNFYIEAYPVINDSGGGGSDDNGGGGTTLPPPEWHANSIRLKEVRPSLTGLHQEDMTFTGKYSSSIFPSSSITYMDRDLKHITVSSWEEVPPKDSPEFYKIIDFSPSRQGSTTAIFVIEVEVQKEDEIPFTISEAFTQVITNDWTRGRDMLVSYTKE